MSAEANYAVQTALERQGPGGSPVIVSSAQNQKGRPQFREGELLVKFVPGINGAGELQKHGMRAVRHFDFIGVHVAALPPGLSVAQGMASLSNNPNVVYAEPNYIYTMDQQQVIPNDPNFGLQWGLHNTGQEIVPGMSGLADADIDAPEAWTIRTSASSVIVAVLDTGVSWGPDLTPNLWKNMAEFNGVPGVDDDGNGIVDDIYGASWTNGNGTPTSGETSDNGNHGTHVAGIIGAVGNNGVGVVGVAWQVQIMALKCLDANGSGFVADAIAAIQYGVGRGAKVMNLSWSGTSFSQALQDAITSANNSAVLFVAAAGNSGADNDQSAVYPANYPVPNVISVAATDHQDQLASFSNYGVSKVHLGAPGFGIYSINPYFGSYFQSGTSMAAAMVSGAAALLRAQYPPPLANITPVQVRSRLMASTDPIAALTGKTISGGRLNLFKALSPCSASLSLRPGLAHGFVAYLGEDTVLSSVLVANCTTVAGGAVVVGFNNGDPPLTLMDNGIAPDLVANDGVYTVKWRPGIGGGPAGNTAGTALPGPLQVTFVAAALSQTMAAPISGTQTERPGYTREPVPFNWIDLGMSGMDLSLTDESSHAIGLFSPFHFYGRDYTQLTIGSNGTLHFVGPHLGWNVPPCIPHQTGYGTETYIAPFWDDLNPGVGGGTVRIAGTTVPNRQTIVQFTNVQRYPSSPKGISFQLILYWETNQIKFQYKDTDFGVPASDKGGTAISGLQGDANHGLAATCRRPEILNNTAVLFTPTRPSCGVSLPLSMTRSGNAVTITFGIGTNRPVTGSWFLGFLIWTGTQFAFVPIPQFSGPFPLLETPIISTLPVEIGALPAFGVMNIFFRADNFPCNSSFAWAPSSAVTSAPSLSREQLDRFMRDLTLQDLTAGKVLTVKP